MEPMAFDDSNEIFSYALENNCSRETYDLLVKPFPDSVKDLLL